MSAQAGIAGVSSTGLWFSLLDAKSCVARSVMMVQCPLHISRALYQETSGGKCTDDITPTSDTDHESMGIATE
jgi:hypothetical protein